MPITHPPTRPSARRLLVCGVNSPQGIPFALSPCPTPHRGTP
ncbi:MAG: hypothetical protein NW237_04185 [Cyanobacteriota bacterium]|nr:hypothetical protein [Cyanobacteriota bacterium]